LEEKGEAHAKGIKGQEEVELSRIREKSGCSSTRNGEGQRAELYPERIQRMCNAGGRRLRKMRVKADGREAKTEEANNTKNVTP